MFEIKQVFASGEHKVMYDLGFSPFENLSDAQMALHEYVTRLIKEHHLENDVLIEDELETVIRGDDMRRAGKRIYRIVKAGEDRG